MKNVLILCFCLFISNKSSAQIDKIYKNKWTDLPQKFTLSDVELKEPHVVLTRNVVVEMIYDEKGDRTEYFTLHKHVKILEDKSVEKFNKVYMPVTHRDQLLYFNARTISKTGKVTKLNKEDIKEIEEEGQRYLILAVSGLEREGEFEYMYTIERGSSLWGSLSLQSDEYARNVSVKIISPENLFMDSKSYNGFPNLKDSIIDGKNVLFASAEKIPSSIEEKYANYTNDLMRVEYKLARNSAGDGSNLLTFQYAGKHYYKYFSTIDKSEEKQVEKLYSKLKLAKLDPENKIRTIENYLKTTIVLEDRAGDNLVELLEKNYGNETGLAKLYFAIFKIAEIKFEILLTSNRYEKAFDPDFDSWIYLKEFLFYFPETGKYLAVADYSYRLGIIPHYFAASGGLYIKEMSIGSIVSGVGQVKKINEADVSLSHDNLDVSVDFSADVASVTLNVKRSMLGHSAASLKSAYYYSGETAKADLDKALLELDIDDAKILERKITNINLASDEAERELIGEAKISSATLIEKANNSILFKVGSLLGKQVEMYQEKPREHNIDVSFPHKYLRKIKINIPDGYVAKGLDVLNINIGDPANKDKGFTSSYKLNGSILEIEVLEFYNQTFYPKSDFEAYKKVVNAAADFNKLSILFEKKL